MVGNDGFLSAVSQRKGYGIVKFYSSNFPLLSLRMMPFVTPYEPPPLWRPRDAIGRHQESDSFCFLSYCRITFLNRFQDWENGKFSIVYSEVGLG
jgi:hypothetical protein